MTTSMYKLFGDRNLKTRYTPPEDKGKNRSGGTGFKMSEANKIKSRKKRK